MAAPVIVQSLVGDNGVTAAATFNANFSAAVTLGNVMIAHVGGVNGPITAPAGWTLAATADVNADTAIHYKQVTPADVALGATPTYTFTNSVGASHNSWWMVEVRGILPIALNAVGVDTVGSQTTLSASPGTTTVADAIAFIIICDGTNTNQTLGAMSFNQSIGTDITNHLSGGANFACNICTGHRILSATNNFTTTTCTWTTSVPADMAFAVFPALPFIPSVRQLAKSPITLNSPEPGIGLQAGTPPPVFNQSIPTTPQVALLPLRKPPPTFPNFGQQQQAPVTPTFFQSGLRARLTPLSRPQTLVPQTPILPPVAPTTGTNPWIIPYFGHASDASDILPSSIVRLLGDVGP